MHIETDRIAVKDRRRVDLGDIPSLADSIRRVGLIHPIVITSDHRLVAGERRLRAVQSLGWPQIEVRLLTDLSEAELREIELEENLHRKGLTKLERNRTLTALADTVAKVLRERSEFSSNLDENSGEGRPSKPDSVEAVAQHIGIPQSELSRARAHVAAVAAHPEVATEPESVAIDYARAAKEQPDLAATDAPPREVVDLAKQRRATQAARDAADTKDVLAAAGALDDLARNSARSRVMRAVREATILLELDAGWAASALDAGDESEIRRFAGRMRAWLDTMEAALPAPMTMLLGGKR